MKPADLLASKYRLEHVLGTGGMGTVWAAVNESTGRPVAIKLMHGSNPKLRSRMLREARAVGTLKHRNIVDLYDAGETESGDSFLVMERLSGETLDEHLQRCGSLPPARAIEIAGAIASALRLAHARGIVHRDFKPANIFPPASALPSSASRASGRTRANTTRSSTSSARSSTTWRAGIGSPRPSPPCRRAAATCPTNRGR
jgi:serine/threonine protein kinase